MSLISVRNEKLIILGYILSFLLILLSHEASGKIWKHLQLTDNVLNDWSPDIDGEGIAFKRNGNVFYLNINTIEEISLTENMDYTYFGPPSVSKGKVVWRAYNQNLHTDSIMLWDGENVTKIIEYESGPFDYDGYPPSYHSLDPYIDNGAIAYSAWDGHDYEIFLLEDNEIIQVSDNETDDYEAQLSEGKISWTGIDPVSQKPDVYYWDRNLIINISNYSWTDEDSNIYGDNVVYAGFDLAGEYKTDIFYWNGEGDAVCIGSLPGYDYEPVINDSLTVWTGWPYGKNSTEPHEDWRSVAWVWDGYKISQLINSPEPVIGADTNGFQIAYMKHDGNDFELFLASYIAGTFKPQEAYQRIHDLLVNENIAFVAMNNGLLQIIDISKPDLPISIATLTIDGGCPIVDVEKNENYIFLATRECGINIIDISNIQNPKLVTTVSTPDSATNIELAGDYLYVGDSIGGFRIIDVRLPENASEISALTLGQVHGIKIIGNFAYVCKYNGEFDIVDISNPHNPVLVNSLTTGVPRLWDLEVKDGFIYLLCPGFGIKIFNIDEPIEPIFISDCLLPDGSEQGYFIPPLDIVIKNNHAFISNGNQGVLVVDISIPEHPKIVERYDTPGYSWGIGIQDKYMYIADWYKGFHLIDISDYFSTLYEDAEDYKADRWEVYTESNGESITNDFDSDRKSRVIRLAGDGLKSGFKLEFELTDDKDVMETKIEWSMKYSENYTIYIDVSTEGGQQRFLTYKPLEEDALGDAMYVQYGLGAETINGQWHTICRDLQADLERAQPGCQIQKVRGFLVKGSGMVDDIKTLSYFPDGNDSDNDGIVDGDEINIYGTNPEVADTDADGIGDGDELEFWEDDWNVDYDTDGIINLLDPDADDDGFLDGEEIEAGSDPGDPGSTPPTVTVYENAEDGSTSGWEIYDDDPSGAEITNIFDEDRQSRIIHLSGSGHSNGYRLRNDDLSNWQNSSQFVIEWSMKYSEFFAVYVDVETTAGQRFITYKPVDYDGLGDGTYVYHGLGFSAIDGQWHTHVRDLSADLQEAQPGVTILEVNGFLIRGSGSVDDIRLRSNVRFATPDIGIQAAIDDCDSPSQTNPCEVRVTPGVYEDHDIKILSHVTVYIEPGSIVKNNATDSDSCVFKNEDPFNGNDKIKIIGDGIVDGNRANYTGGEQFGVAFENVRDSEIKCYIKGCSHLEVKKKNCRNVIYQNLYYERMDKNPRVLCRWSQDEWNSNLVEIGVGTGSQSFVTGSGPNGGNYCRLFCTSDQSSSGIRIKWYDMYEEYLDARYSLLGIWVKFVTDLTTEELYAFPKSWLYVKGEPNISVGYSNALLANEWQKIYFALPAREYNSDLSKVKYFQITLLNRASCDVEMLIGDVTLEPLKNNPRGRVCFSSDDGNPSDIDVYNILKGYGMPYNMAIAVEHPSRHYPSDPNEFLDMYKGGAGIGSHSVSHAVNEHNFKWEMLASKAILKEDGFGDIKVFVPCGGYSRWNGNMNRDVSEYFSARRGHAKTMTFDLDFFTQIDVYGYGDLPDQVKKTIFLTVQSHFNAGLYHHGLLDSDEDRIHSICSFLQEYGIDVVSWGEMFEHVEIKCPITIGDFNDTFADMSAADTDYIYPPTQDFIDSITTGITNPDVPRNITVTKAGFGVPVEGAVVITGITARGEEDSENILVSNLNGTYYGKKPFAVVTQIDGFDVGSGQTLSIGIADKLGLSNWVHRKQAVFWQVRNGNDESVGTLDRVNGTVDCAIISDGDSITMHYRGFTY